MLENTDYSDQTVLEVLKEMIKEIPFSVLEDIIRHNTALNKEFQKGGFHYVEKHKEKAVKIILNDCKGDPHNRTVLFKKWYGKSHEYQKILEPYFTCPEYRNWDGKNETKSDELRKKEQAAFDEFTAVLPRNYVLYFIYFSHIEFDKELTAKWMGSSEQKDSEKIELLRKIIFNKNDEIYDLISKPTEEINNLNERKSPVHDSENLKKQNEMLILKEKELEKLRNEGLTEFIAAKKDEIDNRLKEITFTLEQKKHELEEISNKIKEEKELKEALEEINALKRRELFEYVDKGEKWKKVLFPGVIGEFQKEETPGLKFSKMTGERIVIGNYTGFEQLLESMNFSEDDVIRIRQILNQLRNSPITRVRDMDEMKQIEEFFQGLGHQNGKFVLHTDVSWLTPGYLWETKGYLDGCDTPVIFPDVVAFALKNPGIVFQVEILGANRAPIEGYLGPLLKMLPQKRKIIMDARISEIPINMFFFLQLDSDDYCAKPSPLLNQRLPTIDIISLSKISKDIFVPFDVLFKEE